MEYNEKKGKIILGRELSNLDKFVLDFTSLLEYYVIVSGYVSIILGRARATEDVDLLVPKMNLEDFKNLWKRIGKKGFECLNTSKPEEAFSMLNKYAIRFARKGKAIPNIEFKTIKNRVEEHSFENRIKVIIGKSILFISPLEMQIAYKREHLKSDKDMEDALHIEEIFKDKIDKKKIDKARLIITGID